MTCTFFGHSDAGKEIIPNLRREIINLIENKNADTFYVGNHGQFDFYVKSILGELTVTYPHIKYSVVLAYLPRESEKEYEDFSNTIYPEGIEKAPLKFAIVKRNRWIIEKSDFVITYVNRVIGGATQFKVLAEKKGKTVINIEAK